MKKLKSIVFALIFCVMLCPTVSFSGYIRELSEEETANMHRIFEERERDQKRKSEEREWDQKRKSLESYHMLEQAAIHGDLSKVAQAIADGANVNGLTRNNIPLCLAVDQGHKEIVKFLLEHGANPSLKVDGSGYTPLHKAVFPYKPAQTMKEIAELLIANGADVNARNASGETPLTVLFKVQGHKELMDLLIEKGADINANNNAALNSAVVSGNKEMVELFIEKGADINADNPSLQYAVASGNKEMVELLIKKGADVNARSKIGITALWLASMLPVKGPEIIELLLSAGADVNIKDNQGRTVLTILEEMESQSPLPNTKDIILFLKAHGATH